MVINKTQSSANDGEKKFAFNLTEYQNSMNEANNMDKHLMNAVQGGGIAAEMGNGRDPRGSRCQGEEVGAKGQGARGA